VSNKEPQSDYRSSTLWSSALKIGGSATFLEVVWSWSREALSPDLGVGHLVLIVLLECCVFVLVALAVCSIFRNQGPGKLLMLMAWWLWAGVLLCLLLFPISTNLKAFFLLLACVVATLACGFLLNAVARWKSRLWAGAGRWVRLGVLLTVYTATMAFMVILLAITICVFGSANFFGSCPGGNIFELGIPLGALYSVVLYFIVGPVALTCGVWR
jgi:hypothetical protein